ncbi:hypothetical protein ACLESD_48620 [Pyxidicoccus sp. 3LFB2]
MNERGRKAAVLARFFRQQPDRIAALWRRMRLATEAEGSVHVLGQLDGLVEPFIREVGRTLEGEETSPWSRTRAVLRLSPERGARALYDEFAALRRCLVDAAEVLGGGDWERERINARWTRRWTPRWRCCSASRTRTSTGPGSLLEVWSSSTSSGHHE